MKYKLSKNVVENILSISISGIIIVIAYFIINNYSKVVSLTSSILNIVMPFIFGISIAFIIFPIQKIIEEKIFKNINLKNKTKRNISVLFSVLIMFCVIGSFFAVLIPQLYSSINTFISSFSNYLEKGKHFAEMIIDENEIFAEIITTALYYSEQLIQGALGNFALFLPSLITFSYSFMLGIFNILIGVIIAVYILMDKERFSRQIKQIMYALFSKETVIGIINVTKLTGKMFNLFIFGKAIDSLIIGLICFIFVSITNTPYPLIISFIITITNMIPVFGPFIGAIPCIFMLLIIDPIKAVWFLIFIIILQQIDGNIIGPRILGDSMGLPTLWIMFAIIIGGGLFGVLGMIVGVPIFSVIYILVKKCVNKELEKRAILIK